VLRGLDLTKWLGSDLLGIDPPYTTLQLCIMTSGSRMLLVALSQRTIYRMGKAATAAAELQQRRFSVGE